LSFPIHFSLAVTDLQKAEKRALFKEYCAAIPGAKFWRGIRVLSVLMTLAGIGIFIYTIIKILFFAGNVWSIFYAVFAMSSPVSLFFLAHNQLVCLGFVKWLDYEKNIVRK